MIQPKRKPGRPLKRGAKADIQIQVYLYPDEAMRIWQWMERHNVGQTDAIRQMTKLACECDLLGEHAREGMAA